MCVHVKERHSDQTKEREIEKRENYLETCLQKEAVNHMGAVVDGEADCNYKVGA